MTCIEIKCLNHQKITQFLKKVKFIFFPYDTLRKTFCTQNKREKKKKRIMKALLSFSFFFVQPFFKPFFTSIPETKCYALWAGIENT